MDGLTHLELGKLEPSIVSPVSRTTTQNRSCAYMHDRRPPVNVILSCAVSKRPFIHLYFTYRLE